MFRQLIYNYPEQLFADAGVMAIEHADFEGVERLALVLGMFNKEEEFCFQPPFSCFYLKIVYVLTLAEISPSCVLS